MRRLWTKYRYLTLKDIDVAHRTQKQATEKCVLVYSQIDTEFSVTRDVGLLRKFNPDRKVDG